MKARIIGIISALMLTVGLQAQTSEFETATEAVKNMKVGWNLMNTLDSYADDWIGIGEDYNTKDFETVWGNPVTQPQ